MTPTTDSRDAGKLKMFSALRNRNFRWFWLNGAAQAMAQGMQFLTVGILVLDITGSAYQLGLVIFTYGLPNVLFSLLGGVIADRTDRVRLLISTRFAVSALILALAVLKITDHLEIWHIFTIAFFLGTVQAINMPARMALVADLVERSDMMNAVALHSMMNQSGQILGPALAGGLIEMIGLGPTLFVNAGLYAVGILFLAMIRGLPAKISGAKMEIFRDLQAGLQCVRCTPVLYTVIGLAFAFTFFAMSYRQVLPAFTEEVLDVGAGGTGLLWLGAGLGSLLGSFILATLGDFRRKAWLLVGTLIILCGFLTLFAWSTWYPASWVFFFFVGAGSTGLFWPLVNTLVQLNVPTELRGRVLSILQIAPGIHFLSALPLAIAGDVIGWPIALTAAAVITLFFALWLGVSRPLLRHFED